MIEEGDTVKDGSNLDGIYVRRREDSIGDCYHTVEVSLEWFKIFCKAVVESDLKKTRKEWRLKIGDVTYGRK